MTTLEAPTVTPCPAWCPSAGRHEWTQLLGSERRHGRSVLVAPLGVGGRDIVVTAEVYETPTGSEPLVDLENAEQLYSREQVEQVIAAMREAADLAFGSAPDTFGPERAELDAAIAEVAMRADHPEDINRLVAAAIRLREAHRVLAEVTR